MKQAENHKFYFDEVITAIMQSFDVTTINNVRSIYSNHIRRNEKWQRYFY